MPHVVKKKRKKKWNPKSYRDSLPDKCFLDPVGRKYPVCNKDGSYSCQGLKVAYRLSSLVSAKADKHGYKGGKVAKRVKKKAKALLNKLKECE